MSPLLVSLFAAARAAEIQVVADQPVLVEVDGRMVPGGGGERGATATALAGGAHRVRVLDSQRGVIASANYSVAVEEQLRVELQRGILTELGRGPLPRAAVCPEPPPPAPATLQVTGIAPDDVAVWVDGKPATFDRGSFLVTGLPPGLHDVRVAKGATTLFSGSMKLYPELVRQCVPTGTGRTTTLDCVLRETVLAVPPPAVAPPAPVGPVAMTEAGFVSFLGAVKAESFASDQLGVIRSVAGTNWFTIAQVGRLVDTLAFATDQVEAVRIVASHVTDRENAWQLSQHFQFSGDKEAVAALFK